MKKYSLLVLAVAATASFVFTLTRDDAVAQSPTPSPIPWPTQLPIRINLSGQAVTIGGNSWRSYGDASLSGLTVQSFTNTGALGTPSFVGTNITPIPATDSATGLMLNSAVWSGYALRLDQKIQNGEYDVTLWIMENYKDYYRELGVAFDGLSATPYEGIGKMKKGEWRKYTYRTIVRDGSLTLDLVERAGDPHIMGLEIVPATPPQPLPTITASPSTGHLSGTSPTLWVDFVVNNYTPVGGEIVEFGDGNRSALGYSTAYDSRYDYHVPGTYTVKLLAGSTVITSTQVIVLPDAQASITVFSPNGGEVWQIGSSQTLRYNVSGFEGQNVNLLILAVNQANGREDVLHAGNTIARDGDQGITILQFGSIIGGTLSPGSYRIKVVISRPGTSDVSDVSNAPFTITTSTSQPSITVLSPNGGNKFKSGDTMRISWRAQNIGRVSVGFYEQEMSASDERAGALAGVRIDDIPASQGYYDFKIPSDFIGASNINQLHALKAAVVEDLGAASGSAYDVSDNYFSIAPASIAVDLNGASGGYAGIDLGSQSSYWYSFEEAKTVGLTSSASRTAKTSIRPVSLDNPSAVIDPFTALMLNRAIWSSTSLTLKYPVQRGSYDVYLWMMENYKDNYRTINVKLNGATVASGIGSLPYRYFKRYGPYRAAVSDTTLTLELVKVKGDPHLMGLEIVRVDPQPVLAEASDSSVEALPRSSLTASTADVLRTLLDILLGAGIPLNL